MTTTDTTIETRHDRRITVEHRDENTVLEIVNTSTGRVLGAGLNPAEARELAAALDPGRGTAGVQWTRDEFARLDIHPLSPAGEVIDEVVAWLNAHYPKPQPYDQGGVRGADSLLYRAERAERERDAAVARAEQAGARVRLANQQSVEWEGEAERLLCERDEWKARAEAAEQLIPAYAMLDIWMALGRDSIHFDDWYDEHGYADAWAELTSAVREAAEARTAPAVTRADIEEAIRYEFLDWEGQLEARISRAVNQTWNLVSGADPAVPEPHRSGLDMTLRELIREAMSEARNAI